MNASIQGIIDYMFKNTVDNAETRALHEELLNNCQEHFDDLVSRGMSETEAIDAVVESLKGMKEVIDEYPKKAGLDSENKETQTEDKKEIPTINVGETETKTEVPVKDIPSEYVFSASEIRRIRTDMNKCDLKIGISPDDRIHVRCEDMSQLLCEQDGERLSVRILDQTKQTIEEAGKKLGSQEFTMKGLLNFLGKTIGTVASSIAVSWNVYIDLPAVSLAELNLNSKSGEIHMNAILPEELIIHSMSGEIEVEARDGKAAGKVTVSTMSGDIEFTGNAESITMTSMSGDVEAHGSYQKVEMKSTSGDAKMNGEAEKIMINSVSGDVTIEMRSDKVSDIQARTTSGDVEIGLATGTDSVHATMSTVSGSTSCRYTDSGAGAKLQITAKSVSGDVKIK